MFPNDCGHFIHYVNFVFATFFVYTGVRIKQCNDFRYVILRCPVTFSGFFGFIPVFLDATLHFCIGIGIVQWIYFFATLHHVFGSSYMQRFGFFGASFVRCFDLLAGTLHFFFGAAGRLCSSGFIVPTPSGTPVVSRGNLADGGG